MERFVRRVQNDICNEVLKYEKELGGEKPFSYDQHPTGITRVIQDGKFLEKGGVGISVIQKKMNGKQAHHMLADKDLNKAFTEEELNGSLDYFVAGISMVLHPVNPHIPTVHLNYRYFEILRKDGTSHWWFGGGSDLTPTYLVEEDVTHFHQTLKNACDRLDTWVYDKFKKECDNYFYIKHRGERRGVGGIFFDGLADRQKDKLFNFISDAADSFIPSYFPIVNRHIHDSDSESEKRWQQLRRGRYVEFNLIYDRGTQFGLASDAARVESVLMSLPLTASWEYMHQPGLHEEQLLAVLKTPKDWPVK